MGGGGANSLDSPKIAENSDFEGDEDDTGSGEADGNGKDETTTWTEPTYKTYDDYFTDFNITAETITENDLTGTGSASAPYIVHSTRGFLWLTTLNINSKYIELACDIVLNDEMFDEYGTPRGGDGVVYSWQPISVSKMTFDGNGKEIKGLYCNDSTKKDIGLYSSTNNCIISNFSMSNIFFSGNTHIASLVYSDNNSKINNICVSKTTIVIMKFLCGGIVGLSSRTKIRNCSFDGLIKGGSQAIGGIVGWGDYNTEIYSCKNYGDIYSTHMVGGIIGENIGKQNIISDCENYGVIYGESSIIGGLVGSAYYELKIINSNNFGLVAGTYAGGFIGLLMYYNSFGAVAYISNCNNYGEISGNHSSGFVSSRYEETTLHIKNCANYGKANYAFFGSETLNVLVIIKDCINFGEVSRMAYINHYEFTNCVDTYNKKWAGNDLSSFCRDFKTGEIGLKSMSGKGFYQQTLIIELLEGLGYEKY